MDTNVLFKLPITAISAAEGLLSLTAGEVFPNNFNKYFLFD